MRSTKVLTPRGVAHLLSRGLRANFAPERQAVEANRLVDYLQDLTMSRATDGELPGCLPAAATQAERDADWLEAIADELEELAQPSRRVPKI
jgi:hypothetical protein